MTSSPNNSNATSPDREVLTKFIVPGSYGTGLKSNEEKMVGYNLRISIALRRCHDSVNIFEGKYLIGGLNSFRVLVHYHNGGT